MKKIISQILIGLLFITSISSQTEEQIPAPFIEFGRINLEEIMQRLDFLIYELSNKNGTKAHIKIYGGNEAKGYFYSNPYLRGSLFIAYLKNNRKLPSERFSIEYCNVNNEELRTQFFILPQNNQLPKCEENLKVPVKTTHFENIYFYWPTFKLTPIEETIIEIGPSAGNYSKIALNVLHKMLNDSAGSKLYVIAYRQTNSEYDENGKLVRNKKEKMDKKSVSKKMLQAARDELVKNGFDTLQIEFIDGGYINSERRLEFWFVPKDGEIPKPKPDYFPK